jgi:hypothetical protein
MSAQDGLSPFEKKRFNQDKKGSCQVCVASRVAKRRKMPVRERHGSAKSHRGYHSMEQTLARFFQLRHIARFN